MTIRTRTSSFEIPNYSLTGDLLAFLNCRMQYRFNSKGSLPPASPVQQWFGEFIHGVMEEGFLQWKEDGTEFPWSPETVQNLCVKVAARLTAKGLKPNRNLFAVKDTSKRRAMDFIANKRAYLALNSWGPALFPLIDRNEVKLSGMRDMPDFDPETSRASYYTVTGVADVITSVQRDQFPDNVIIKHLREDPRIREMMDAHPDFEVLIDYKGMTRPEIGDDGNEWDQHAWQILTYMWLRELQLEADGVDRPVIAGALLYLNEMALPSEGYKEVARAVEAGRSDVPATAEDLRNLKAGQMASNAFREARSIRVIPYDKGRIEESLGRFDAVVKEIERCVSEETRDSGNVMRHWCGNEYQRDRCTACDVKCFCVDVPESERIRPKVP